MSNVSRESWANVFLNAFPERECDAPTASADRAPTSPSVKRPFLTRRSSNAWSAPSSEMKEEPKMIVRREPIFFMFICKLLGSSLDFENIMKIACVHDDCAKKTLRFRYNCKPPPPRVSAPGEDGLKVQERQGRLKAKVVPFSSSLLTATLPPCSSTMCFTMLRPSPVPPLSRERPLSTR